MNSNERGDTVTSLLLDVRCKRNVERKDDMPREINETAYSPLLPASCCGGAGGAG